MLDYTEDELNWAKSLIKPELPDYDDKDHEIARLRYILGEIHEELGGLHFDTSEWAQENKGVNWYGKMKRRLTNFWWELTGRKMRRFIPRDPVRTVEAVHTALGKLLYDKDGDCRIPDGTSIVDIDRYADLKYWDDIKHAHNEEIHCGDCTAVPATCMKCYAEQFYDFESPWEDKAKGSKALSIYIDYMKAEKENTQ